MTVEEHAGNKVTENLNRTREEMRRRRQDAAAASTPAKAPVRPVDGRRARGATDAKGEATPGRSEDAKRWATSNTFDDVMARNLTLAEQAVWKQLFRHCRDGLTSVSTRGIAEAIGVAPNTVTEALRWLKARRLIWDVAKSKHRGAASVYGMRRDFGSVVEECAAAHRARRGGVSPRKPR